MRNYIKTAALFTAFSLTAIFATAQIKQPKEEVRPYIDFLEENKFLPAKEYILSKFETNDIIIFSERYHHDQTQYDVIMDVVRDERFKGHIYTEIGSESLTKRFNDFLMNSTLTPDQKEIELRKLYRDLSPSILWGPYNYYFMLSEVWEINKTRKDEDKILIFPLDIWLDYNSIQTNREWAVHWYFIYNTPSRDAIMGSNFVHNYEQVKAERPQALVILNTIHGIKQYPTYLPLPTRPLVRRSGEYIWRTYPDKTFVVYINSSNSDTMVDLSNGGIIDAAFEYTGKDNIGFDLKGTPIGSSKFDLFSFGEGYDTNIDYNFIYDGMIFYKPLKEMVIKLGVPNIYPKDEEELYFKRASLISNKSIEEVKKDSTFIQYLHKFNTPFEMTIDEYLEDKALEKWNAQIQQWFK